MSYDLLDLTKAMETAEIHLAVAPAKSGGRVRLTWTPGQKRLSLVETRSGEQLFERVDDDSVLALKKMHAEFAARAK